MEPALNKPDSVIASASTPPKGPRYVTRKQKLCSLSRAAIAAAALAAVTITAGVRKQQRAKRTPEKKSRTPTGEFRPRRRRNQKEVAAVLCASAVSPQCKHPGCHCQFFPSAQSENRAFHSSSSSLEGERCTYCEKILTEVSKCNCCKAREGAAQNFPRELQHFSSCQRFGYYSQALPEYLTFPENSACCAFHECCCDHQSPSNSSNRGRVAPVGFCPIKTCCAQRMRHAVNTIPNVSNSTICRKRHIHPQAACCDSHPQCPKPQTPVRTVKALKPAKSKPRDQRVQARRIRHPACDEDSNSESELCAPVTDVRALRSAPTNSSTSSSPGQAMPLINHPTRPLAPVGSLMSCPLGTGSPKANSGPGPSLRVNTLLTAPPAYSNVITAYNVTQLPQRREEDKDSSSSSSSSDSSKTSDIPGTVSSTSSDSDGSTDLSDSSTSSNEESGTTPPPPRYTFPRSFVPSASTSQPFQPNDAHVRNPIHTYYQNPHVNSSSSRSVPLPISSGDFWNVRRPWPNTASERRTNVPGYAATTAREGDPHAAQWAWMGQHSASNPAVQHLRNVRRMREHRYNA